MSRGQMTNRGLRAQIEGMIAAGHENARIAALTGATVPYIKALRENTRPWLRAEAPPRADNDRHIRAVQALGGFSALPFTRSPTALFFDGERLRRTSW